MHLPIMEELGIHLEEDERQDFFGYVKKSLHAPRNSGVSIYDHFDTNSSVIWKHQNGEYNVLPFDLFSRLYSVAYESGPRYDLSNLDEYVENINMSLQHMNKESFDHKFSRRTQLVKDDKDIFSFVFNHFELEELANRFNGTEAMFKNWRTGKTKTVDRDILRDTAEEVREFYESRPEISPDLVDMKAYKGNTLEKSTLVEEADRGTLEVLFYRKDKEDLRDTAKMVEEGNSPTAESCKFNSRLENVYPHLFNEILERSEESGFVKSSKSNILSTDTVGHGFSLLNDIQLLESWGSDSNGVYQIDAEKPEIYDAWRRIANKHYG